MTIKLYKEEKINLPNGEELVLIPFEFQDFSLIFDYFDVEKQEKEFKKKLAKQKVRKRKPVSEEEAKKQELQFQMEVYGPMINELAQLELKRLDTGNYKLTPEEAKKLPDIPGPVDVIVEIAMKTIKISINDFRRLESLGDIIGDVKTLKDVSGGPSIISGNKAASRSGN